MQVVQPVGNAVADKVLTFVSSENSDCDSLPKLVPTFRPIRLYASRKMGVSQLPDACRRVSACLLASSAARVGSLPNAGN